MAARPGDAPAGRDPAAVPDNERDVQDAVIQAVVVEKAVVVVEGLTVVSGEHDDGVLGHPSGFQLL